jgi:hypothetical protein
MRVCEAADPTLSAWSFQASCAHHDLRKAAVSEPTPTPQRNTTITQRSGHSPAQLPETLPAALS